MPLTAASMSAQIQAEIITQLGAPADSSQLQKFCDAVGKAVVENIQANAEVTVTGVQSGSSSATGTVG